MNKGNTQENTKTKPPIWSLTPKVLTEEKDIKKIQPYLDALKAGILDSEIKNIALTGDYGSGKSTVLSTFQNQNQSFEYLNLSLASFKDEGKDLEAELEEIKENNNSIEKKGSIESKLESLNRLIEVSILQQLIYQAPPEDIPDSRFQRIIGLSNKKLIWFATGGVLWLMSFFILFRFGGLQKANPENWTFILRDISFDTVLAIPTFFFGIGFFMFKVGRVLSNSKISKVNIKGEVELGKDLDKSILNKHLDEILYFFEQTKFNVVVIEDLDRFRNTQVFTKLREINLLLNKSASIVKQNRKIVFIYAIRDEMFVNSERVKFFDYIIPVIPFINPSNAKDQFFNLLKVEKLENELGNEFIEDVVTYIDDIDMRLLINVFQEFSIYKQQMGVGIILENLFALILYKNLYPKDFTKLPRRKGNLYKFFNNKSIYLNEIINVISVEIEDSKNKITAIETEKLNRQNELNGVYLSAIKKKTDAIEIKLDSEWMLFNDLYEDDNLITLIDQNEFEYRYLPIHPNYRQYHFSRQSSKAKFDSIEDEVDIEHSFYERQQFIEDKGSASIELLKEELLDKENTKRHVETWNIQQIFNNITIKKYLKDFEHKELVGNLLTNGYIDENYIDYITLFHEAKITISDKEFIKKVKSGQQSDYDYYLTKPNEIIKDIPSRYFSRKEILNYHILGYVLRWGDKFLDKKEMLINQICEVKKGTKEEFKMFQFVDGYIQFYENPKNESLLRTSSSIPELIKLLSSNTGLLWNTILKSNTSAQKQIDKYLKLVVIHSEPEKLAKNRHTLFLKDYLKEYGSVINLFKTQENIQKLATIFQILDFKFLGLVPKSKNNSQIYDFIYQNNHYYLTPNNIKEILRGYNSIESKLDESKFNEKNYTIIQESDCKNLKEYIDFDINLYLENIFLKLPDNVKESEKSLISLLNHKKIKEELKERIIKKQKTKINDIRKIENQDNIIELLNYERLDTSWSNMINYYINSEDKIDLPLTDYLNKQHIYDELSKNKIPDKLEEIDNDKIEKISISLILCEKLDQKAYEAILKSLPPSYSKWERIHFNELQEEKVSYLIENNFLSLTQENFDLIDEKFEDLKANFLVKNQKHVKDALDDSALALIDSDIDLLLNSDIVPDDLKEELIKEHSRSRITSDSEIAKLTGILSSKHNRSYLTYEELNSIFDNGGNTPNEKLKMLNNHFDKLEDYEIRELLDLTSKDHSNIFDNNKRPKFRVIDESIKLAENLKQKGLIKSFHYEKDGRYIRFYPIT